MEKQDKKPNHLKGQTSPYLLQHLYNPVDWHPWGEQALNKARQEDKPILVSIGYSACHWCHVMEKESFENEEVARKMNENFVCIKVDREERPDIDHLYMGAVQLLSGHGGWPLNCFALPDGRPFWGGTYFPKHEWLGVLSSLAEVYEKQREKVEQQAHSLTQGVTESSFIKPATNQEAFSPHDADAFFNNLIRNADKEDGGRKGAPKFPMPVNNNFLLNYFYHRGDHHALDQVMLTLRKMAMGGIYDQLGGGFSRYSTDEFWKVPHFEKMLYDNAQLVSLYSDAWKAQQDDTFREVVFDTIAFVERELTSPEGVFYSALDADSEGEEGKFYVWTEKQVEQVLGKDATMVKKYFNMGGKGLWEKGNNILLRTTTAEDFAREHKIDLKGWKNTLNEAKSKLLEKRNERVAPGLDNKVLVSWNALMIKGLADAWAAFGQKDFLDKATRAADYILENALEPSGKLYRTLSNGKPAIDGFLEDYAHLTQALIRLYETTTQSRYLQKAHLLARYVINEFDGDESSLLPFSPAKGEQLAAPFYDFFDNVIPSSNSVMATNLLYLANYFAIPEWAQRSSLMLGDIKQNLEKYSSHFSNWGSLILRHVFPLYTLAVCGRDASREIPEIHRSFYPNVLLAVSTKNEKQIPLLEGRFRKDETWFYLCRMGICQTPVKSFDEVKAQIREAD